ncbi:gluconolaconase [Mycobacterium sp. 1245111.1]|uniref:SMP-30/gluconolactonase/LRE family protein n=1 Tax=Mycobacterium sp. 1245111.1 TaxID=1834073 RepID=UPI0008001CCC|nr:SMP-30/gluconolactonase/LRE family protein [Mycobacterium sp. 1245111.1]OBK35613.1 gluconolaconase [Mycobacterium sp. 1245111.1]
MRCIAKGLGFPESPIVSPDGSVLVSEIAVGRISRVQPDGRVETFCETGGGPNGIAWLPDGRLLVCQNGGQSFGLRPWPLDIPGAIPLLLPCGPPEHPVTPQLQLISADGATISTLATSFVSITGEELPLARPSDVCVDDAGGFYLTEGIAMRGRMRGMTGLLYGTPDGQLRELVYPLELPNGVALSPDGGTVYVAETRTRRVWEFEVLGPGRLGRGRTFATVPTGGPMNFGGADGLCVDAAGRVIVATIGAGGVTVFAPDGALLGAITADDPMTTNAGLSPDGRSLFITLASSGRLVSVDDWLDAVHTGSTR